MATPIHPPITAEITTGSCKILIRGKRSAKGWNILRMEGKAQEPILLDYRKSKDDAIQYACDACEPDTSATYLIRPASSLPHP